MELQKCSVGWRIVMSRIREENFLPLPNVIKNWKYMHCVIGFG